MGIRTIFSPVILLHVESEIKDLRIEKEREKRKGIKEEKKKNPYLF